MGKNYLGIAAALLLAGTPGAFAAAGVGAQGGYTVNGGAEAAVTMRASGLPLVFALEGAVGTGGWFSLGGVLDYWIANPVLAGFLHAYYGPGLAAGVAADGGSRDYLYAAGRFVAGVNVFLLDPLELYAQAAGQVGARFPDGAGVYWAVPVSAGFRWWF